MDYSWSDPKVIVPIYAAIVATTSLGWNIIKTILDSRGFFKSLAFLVRENVKTREESNKE